MWTAVNDSTPSADNEFGLRASAAWSIESWSFFCLFEGIGNFDGLGSVHKYSWVIGSRFYLRETWNLRAKYVGTAGRSDIDHSGGNMLAASIDLALSESALFFFTGALTFNEDNASYNMVNSGLFWTFLPVEGQDVRGFSAGTILVF